MYAYCLFCETIRCRAIAIQIERATGGRCISPQLVQLKWVKGEPQKIRHDWLPGYVFLYTEEPIQWTQLAEFRVPGIIRMLGDEETQHVLTGNDLSFAQMLLEHDGVIGNVRVADVGDRIAIDDPAWSGVQGKIVKVDRHRKRCCVEFMFDGVARSVWVAYEKVEIAEAE